MRQLIEQNRHPSPCKEEITHVTVAIAVFGVFHSEAPLNEHILDLSVCVRVRDVGHMQHSSGRAQVALDLHCLGVVTETVLPGQQKKCS